nr:unnamed protein product [Spirometra erinaceieuropaei]
MALLVFHLIDNVKSVTSAHSTRSGHTFKVNEEIILARGDNRVSRELLGSWFTDPKSIKKRNDPPLPYSVLSLRLDGVIGHAGSVQANTFPNAEVGGSDGRSITTPKSNTRDEIAAINDANVGHQSFITPSATISDEGGETRTFIGMR